MARKHTHRKPLQPLSAPAFDWSSHQWRRDLSRAAFPRCLALTVRHRLSLAPQRCLPFAPCMAYLVLLLELGNPLFQASEVRNGHHVGHDRPQRHQPDRLGFGVLASSSISSVTQVTRRDIRPTARSRDSRRIDSTSARVSGWLARRWAVRSPMRLALAHSAHDSALRDRGGKLALEACSFFSGHVAHWHAMAKEPPRLLLAPLAVVSPGPRLAAAHEWARKVTRKTRGEQVRDETWFKTSALRASFAPICASESGEKHGENREKRAEKCREMSGFRGPRASFRRARGRRRENVTR